MADTGCVVCEDGRACNCQIEHRLDPGLEPSVCACLGFQGCRLCGRKSDMVGWLPDGATGEAVEREGVGDG